MGSGVVKSQQPQQQQQQQQQQQPNIYHNNPYPQHRGPALNSSRRQTDAGIMTCDSCSANFTLFKRKHQCKECNRYFCSKCMAKEPNRSSSQRRCNTCRILSSPDTFDKNELMTLKIKDLRQHLIANNVTVSSCTEKNDLVELLLRYYANRQNSEAQARNQQSARSHQQHQSQSQAPTSTQSQHTNVNSTTNSGTQPSSTPTQSETEEDRLERLRRRQQEEMRRHEARRMADSPEVHLLAPPETRPARQRASISDLSTVDDIGSMTIRQLKEVLATNFVDFKGCVEKWELVERVRRLFREKEDQRQRAEEILKDYRENETKEENSNSSSSGTDTGGYTELCKICMDSPIDCVLLECGHMITCTKCGKRMSECPVCRQYVVRVVHTFKA
ncbi:E3 ubiquitin-protein ligase RNF34-like isoform X2 [Glandiceps talaboti]